MRGGGCDACALGVVGLGDAEIDALHLCAPRLRLVELDVADPLDPLLLGDLSALGSRNGAELRGLGRLTHPMRRRAGERGFSRVSWQEALATIAAALSSATPERVAWYLGGWGLTNETAYVAGKAARALGSANIDSEARLHDAASREVLRATTGLTGATCSLQDVLDADLVVLWGTNPASTQPGFMKYLTAAVKRGATVVAVNPFPEPGLDRFWELSSLESLLFGSRVARLRLAVRPGGDVAFANAVLRRLIDRGEMDRHFIDRHTLGWGDLVSAVTREPIDELLSDSGLSAQQLEDFVDLYAAAASTVFVWSTGVTQRRDGIEGVGAIVNVALARGNVGRDGAGLLPMPGQPGTQGCPDMGAWATTLPGGAEITPGTAAALAARWRFEVPARRGLTAPEMIDAASAGDLEVLWCSGGDLLESLPDPSGVRAALGKVSLRVHSGRAVTPQMLVEGGDVILLPTAARHEQEGGATVTTMDQRVFHTPQVCMPPGEARSEWRVLADVVRAVRADLEPWFSWSDQVALRREIASLVTSYAGIEALRRPGDTISVGKRFRCDDGVFPTAEGRARFTPLDPPPEPDPRHFVLSTRRGGQSDVMARDALDPLTGAGRDAVFIDHAEAAGLGLGHGDRVLLRSATGAYEGRLHCVELPALTVQVHWPEGNVLLAGGPLHRGPLSGTPDNTTAVTIVPL